MNKEFIHNLLKAFLFTDKQNDYWLLTSDNIKIMIERFGKKVNYQEIDDKGSLIKGYWLLEDKSLYGPYTDHMK